MRIHDMGRDQTCDEVTLFLTRSEVEQFRSYLEQALDWKGPSPSGEHAHFHDEEYDHEIIICVYDENDLEGLHERAKRVIHEDS